MKIKELFKCKILGFYWMDLYISILYSIKFKVKIIFISIIWGIEFFREIRNFLNCLSKSLNDLFYLV